MIISLIVAVAVIAAVFRVWSPWGAKSQGAPLRTLRMPFAARLSNQAGPMLALAAASALNVLVTSVPFWVPLAPLALLALSVVVPASYTLTTDGVMIGRLTFRRWTEFSGVTVRRGRLRLKSISGVRPLQIWLPGRFHDADTVGEIRGLIRNAYQGRSSTPVSDHEPAPASESESSMAVV